jgi:hypothetical protein
MVSHGSHVSRCFTALGIRYGCSKLNELDSKTALLVDRPLISEKCTDLLSPTPLSNNCWIHAGEFYFFFLVF